MPTIVRYGYLSVLEQVNAGLMTDDRLEKLYIKYEQQAIEAINDPVDPLSTYLLERYQGDYSRLELILAYLDWRSEPVTGKYNGSMATYYLLRPLGDKESDLLKNRSTFFDINRVLLEFDIDTEVYIISPDPKIGNNANDYLTLDDNYWIDLWSNRMDNFDLWFKDIPHVFTI
jgi:hypothetical protein